MQLGLGIIVAIIALAAAAGAAYYVQTQHAATTTSHTETPGTSIPVTTSTAPATTVTSPTTTTSATSSPSPTSTTTRTTTTHTVTATAASTTTTQTTTLEQTTTTSTTTSKEEVLEPTVFHTYRELLQNYSYAKIHYKLVNGSETTELVLSYRASKTSNRYRADINTAQIENGETSSNNTITIFLDKTMTTVTKIIMPGGQVYEGQMAQIAGRNILEALNHAIAMIAWVGDIKVAIAEGGYAATKAGWEVISVEKTSATISGKTYHAYKVSMLNKSDKNSDTTRIDFTLAETKKDTWIAYKLHAVQKDGSEFTWEITDLEP